MRYVLPLLVTVLGVYTSAFASCGTRTQYEPEDSAYYFDLNQGNIVQDKYSFDELYATEVLDELDYESDVHGIWHDENYVYLTHADFIEDLNYMLYVLENNFSLFDVAYWARGVDIYALAENAMGEVLANPYLDVDEFFMILLESFRPLSGIGHFSFVNPSSFDFFNSSNAGIHGSGVMRLRSPRAAAFYEPRRDIPISDRELMAFFSCRHVDVMADTLKWHGETDLAKEIYQAFEDGDAVRFMQIARYERNLRDEAPFAVKRSLVEGKIAFLAIDDFWPSFAPHPGGIRDLQIQDFFEEINGYEHLIIDLRRNRGGFYSFFLDYIMRLNIDSRVRLYSYVFLRYGEYAAPIVENLGSIGGHGPGSFLFNAHGEDLTPVEDMLLNLDLQELNMDDMQRMDYGFRASVSVSPRRLSRFDYQPAFTGNIWMLTGPGMASASQISAWIAKESGFATLVGDITGGVFGGTRTIATLPNTGIAFQMDLFYMTDGYGRPFEAGTIPHYFNRERMCALETVLAMIEEMSGN